MGSDTNARILSPPSTQQMRPGVGITAPNSLFIPQTRPNPSIATSGTSFTLQMRPIPTTSILNPPPHSQATNAHIPTQQTMSTLSSNNQYVLLCFNSGGLISLVHLDIPAAMTDPEFYEKVRETYYKHRGWWRQWLSLNVLLRVHFVKVTALNRRIFWVNLPPVL